MKKDISTILYFVRFIMNSSKLYFMLFLISAVISSLLPLVAITMPKYIINELIGAQRLDRLITYVLVIVITNIVFGIINLSLNVRLQEEALKINSSVQLNIDKKMMYTDYANLENAKLLNLKNEVMSALNNEDVINRFLILLKNIISAVISIVIIGAIISRLNFFIVIAIIGIIMLNAYVFKQSQKLKHEYYNNMAQFDRKWIYYIQWAKDFTMAKDVRLYNMSPLLLNKIREYHNDSTDISKKLNSSIGKNEGFININLQVQMLLIYGYMIYKVFSNKLSIGDFTMYVSASNRFSNSIASVIESVIEIRQLCRYLSQYIDLEGVLTNKKTDGKKIKDIKSVSIEFKNVSFSYEGMEKYALKDVSICLQPGEKLAVIGENGAGKTTFIKLLCRLYEPQKGEILLNGVNIYDIQYDEYIKLISAVFQDFQLFNLSIKENISFDASVNDDIVWDVIEKSGLAEKISSLSSDGSISGINTQVFKIFDETGTDFSGGERQKIAIARAIYKNSPIIIMDEPTAALDPYAEYDIYTKTNDAFHDNTVIFISHRLSSCKFCDNIAVFDNGQIIEYGSHDELIYKNGKYTQMWNAQAQYYTKQS